ncbi:MAG: hypothetical protein JXP34_16385 [Planctomycetes bacterium]|nr:hypothetical protein [Planctomycetota bacterium]
MAVAVLLVSGGPILAFLGPLEKQDAESPLFPFALALVVLSSLVGDWGLVSGRRWGVRGAAFLMAGGMLVKMHWVGGAAVGLTFAASYLAAVDGKDVPEGRQG